MIKIVPLYAALLGLFFVYLSFRTISVRRKKNISIGDGGDQSMLRAMRMHANFSEYTPIGLILLILVEVQGGAAVLLHALGVLFLLARLAHAYGISSAQASGKMRVGGMAGTFTTIFVAAIWLIIEFFPRF